MDQAELEKRLLALEEEAEQLSLRVTAMEKAVERIVRVNCLLTLEERPQA